MPKKRPQRRSPRPPRGSERRRPDRAASRRRTGKRRLSKGATRPAGRTAIRIRPIDRQKGFELVYPACVRERREDMEEVYKMLELGEIEAAEDELRWLLDGCRELLEAHRLLGLLALESARWSLARAHLGYAFELVSNALGDRFDGTLPYARPANRPFHEAGHDLVRCLLFLGERSLAQEVADRLRQLDPDDPLGTAELLNMLPVAMMRPGGGDASGTPTAAVPRSQVPPRPEIASDHGGESSREGGPAEGDS